MRNPTPRAERLGGIELDGMQINLLMEADITFNSSGIVSIENKKVEKIPVTQFFVESYIMLLGSTAEEVVNHCMNQAKPSETSKQMNT